MILRVTSIIMIACIHQSLFTASLICLKLIYQHLFNCFRDLNLIYTQRLQNNYHSMYALNLNFQPCGTSSCIFLYIYLPPYPTLSLLINYFLCNLSHQILGQNRNCQFFQLWFSLPPLYNRIILIALHHAQTQNKATTISQKQ